MTHEDLILPSEQRALITARMSDSMTSSVRWLKAVGVVVLLVVVMTFFASAVVMFTELRPDTEATRISSFLDAIVTMINYVLILVYVFGSLSVFYFLRYLYLDYLLKRTEAAASR